MKIVAYPFLEDKFEVSSWWTTTPETLVETLRQQLLAAKAIWPELKDVKIVGKVNHEIRE